MSGTEAKKQARRDAEPTWLDRHPHVHGTMVGAVVGGALACVMLLPGVFGAGWATARGHAPPLDGLAGLLSFHFGGYVAGGALAGALAPFHSRIGGHYGLAIVMMTVVSAAIARYVSGPVSTWTAIDWILVPVMGALFGVALARGVAPE